MSNKELLKKLSNVEDFKAYKVAPVKVMTVEEALEKGVKEVWKEATGKIKVETKEGIVDAPESPVICKGADDEVWPQKKSDLEKKYVKTDEVDKDGWTTWKISKKEVVKVKKVPFEFSVNTSWGEKLTGKKGDYLVIKSEEDMWIVDEKLFEKTYKEEKGD